MWPALRRGYDVLIFDGPGQQSELFERNVPFRPDWEHVISPVYDFIVGLDGVDAERVALYGDQSGQLLGCPCAGLRASFRGGDHRSRVFVDASTRRIHQIPKGLLKTLDEGQDAKFDKEMAFGMQVLGHGLTWAVPARPYGTPGYGR